MAAVSPQLGYNHNIPHRGRLYHVQTEDSGVDRGHIFTHVFFDGTIVASNKVEYREERDKHENLDAFVIGLMQESHKAMIRKLRAGAYDEKILRVIGEHPAESNAAAAAAAVVPAAAPTGERGDRREPPKPRDVEPQGPPLRPAPPGPTVDPSLSHPVFASREAQAQVASGDADAASRPPSRMRRRAVGGIGGQGVRADVPAVAVRRDVIVGKFASAHQADLDEEILALLREDA